MKKLLLKEVYASEICLHEARRFLNISAFKKMNTQQQALYLSKLKPMGAGSARKVFLIGSKTVLKWAYHERKGTAQNEAEVELLQILG